MTSFTMIQLCEHYKKRFFEGVLTKEEFEFVVRDAVKNYDNNDTFLKKKYELFISDVIHNKTYLEKKLYLSRHLDKDFEDIYDEPIIDAYEYNTYKDNKNKTLKIKIKSSDEQRGAARAFFTDRHDFIERVKKFNREAVSDLDIDFRLPEVI